MWEDETVVLVTSLKKRILSGKESVRFTSIQSDNAIPAFIRILFKNRMEQYIREESPFTLKSTPHFDFEDKSGFEIKEQLSTVLREIACFPAEEVDEILREALVTRLNYLIHPVDTLRKIIFEGGTEISVEKLNKQLRGFESLAPYADMLVQRVSGEIDPIDNDIFTRNMADILQELAAEDPIKRVIEDFSILTDFLSETKGEDVSRIEGTLLQEFLADRNMYGFRRAVDVEMKLGKVDFEAAELEMTLRRYEELKAEFGASRTETRPEKGMDEPERENKNEQIFKGSPDEEENESSDEADWILDGILTEDLTKEEKSAAGSEEPEEKERTEDQPKTKQMRIIRREKREEAGDEDSLIETDQSGEERPEQGEDDTLGSVIDERSQKSFVKKLFSGDTVGYRKLIEKLNEADSWRVAKILIDNELFKRDVDPFSREAIKLVDLVYGRYYPEEGVGGGK